MVSASAGLTGQAAYRETRLCELNLLTRLQQMTATVDRPREPGRRPLTMRGEGGVGQTQPAIKAAPSIAEHGSGGRCCIPLASVGDPALVIAVIARSLGLRETGQAQLDDRPDLLSIGTRTVGGSWRRCSPSSVSLRTAPPQPPCGMALPDWSDGPSPPQRLRTNTETLATPVLEKSVLIPMCAPNLPSIIRSHGTAWRQTKGVVCRRDVAAA